MNNVNHHEQIRIVFNSTKYFFDTASKIYNNNEGNKECHINLQYADQLKKCLIALRKAYDFFSIESTFNIHNELHAICEIIERFADKFSYKKRFLKESIIVINRHILLLCLTKFMDYYKIILDSLPPFIEN